MLRMIHYDCGLEQGEADIAQFILTHAYAVYDRRLCVKLQPQSLT